MFWNEAGTVTVFSIAPFSCHLSVYRSNWLGAAGHEERKRAAQQGQPRVAT